MSEGRYPGLYSDLDMQNMATAMTPGQVQTKKLDKIELSFERYLKKVRQNMHIFVSLDISGNLIYAEANVNKETRVKKIGRAHV